LLETPVEIAERIYNFWGKKGVASLILKIILNHEATCLHAGKHRQAKHTPVKYAPLSFSKNFTGQAPVEYGSLSFGIQRGEAPVEYAPVPSSGATPVKHKRQGFTGQAR
jgi:hypothetical protein